MNFSKFARAICPGVLWALTGLLLAHCGMRAEPDRPFPGIRAIHNGTLTAAYPSVGELLGDGRCSATVVAPGCVVTASHCVGQVETFYPEGRRTNPNSFERVRKESSYSVPQRDIAILPLTLGNVTNWNEESPSFAKPNVADRAVLVGFGNTSGLIFTNDAGRRHSGEGRVSAVSLYTEVRPYLAGNPNVPANAAPDQYACGGDSGGAMFVNGSYAGVIDNGSQSCIGSSFTTGNHFQTVMKDPENPGGWDPSRNWFLEAIDSHCYLDYAMLFSLEEDPSNPNPGSVANPTANVGYHVKFTGPKSGRVLFETDGASAITGLATPASNAKINRQGSNITIGTVTLGDRMTFSRWAAPAADPNVICPCTGTTPSCTYSPTYPDLGKKTFHCVIQFTSAPMTGAGGAGGAGAGGATAGPGMGGN